MYEFGHDFTTQMILSRELTDQRFDLADVCGRAGQIQVVHTLKVQPIFRRCAQRFTNPQRGVRSDGTVAAHDFVYPTRWRADRFG